MSVDLGVGELASHLELVRVYPWSDPESGKVHSSIEQHRSAAAYYPAVRLLRTLGRMSDAQHRIAVLIDRDNASLESAEQAPSFGIVPPSACRAATSDADQHVAGGAGQAGLHPLSGVAERVG
jgi:hypothetical protein